MEQDIRPQYTRDKHERDGLPRSCQLEAPHLGAGLPALERCRVTLQSFRALTRILDLVHGILKRMEGCYTHTHTGP